MRNIFFKVYTETNINIARKSEETMMNQAYQCGRTEKDGS